MKGSHGIWKERAEKITYKFVKKIWWSIRHWFSVGFLGHTCYKSSTNMVPDFAHWILVTTENRNYFIKCLADWTRSCMIRCGEEWGTTCRKEHMRDGVYYQVDTKEMLEFIRTSEDLAWWAYRMEVKAVNTSTRTAR